MTARLALALGLTLLAAGHALAMSAPSDPVSDLPDLRQAALAGNISSMYALGRAYADGVEGTRPDSAEAASWWRKAAAAGHTDAQRELALLHIEGRGVPQTFDEARRLLFLAANKNDTEAQFHLAMLIISGRGGDMTVSAGIQWLERAAETGHRPAQLELGIIYLNGSHIEVDSDRGRNWLERAVSQGHTPAMYQLASLYESGKLSPQQPGQARDLFERAAAAGHAKSQVWLARWYERQDPPDYREAISHYRAAAAQGDSDGHYGVARLNLDRLVRTSNAQEGLRHLHLAVGLDHPEAHFMLGQMYGNGALGGGSTNALDHFHSAARLGHAGAMYELGIAHYHGTPPLRKNPTMAAHWWRRASLAGHLESQYAFALLHLNGIGVQRNPGVAFAIVNVAAAQGHPDAGAVRDQLLSSLPPDILREAQELSVRIFQQYVAGADTAIRERLK